MGCIPLIASILDGRILVVTVFWSAFIAFGMLSAVYTTAKAMR